MEHKNIDDCEFIAIKTAIIRSYLRHGPCRLMNVGDLHHVLEKNRLRTILPIVVGDSDGAPTIALF